MEMQFTLGILIFVITFYFIVSEKISPVWASIFGGMAMIITGIINEHEAFEAISRNLEILFLLIGMMIIVNIIAETGLFQWFAIKIAQVAKGEPVILMALLALLTGVFSAFLDNVTTILLMAPVSILLASQLKIDSFPFLMIEIMASNIGGAATLIGDPPNLIIGSEADFYFNDFLIHMAPIAILNLALVIIIFYFVFGNKMKVSRDLKARIMQLDAKKALKNPKLTKISLLIFFMVIFGFLTDAFFHKGLATIALSGSVFLCILIKRNPHETLKEVEWETLFFFIGLFILVKGIEEINIIDIVGEKIIELSYGSSSITSMIILWFSTLSTALIGNISHTVTFSKVIHVVEAHYIGIDTNVFWWALSMGACFGGNSTLIASAANIIALGTSQKAGNKIPFSQFVKYGFSITLFTTLTSSIYILFRYL
jgi:Na+/H+ antiporter NhaD/arsenite permease-like protein